MLQILRYLRKVATDPIEFCFRRIRRVRGAEPLSFCGQANFANVSYFYKIYHYCQIRCIRKGAWRLPFCIHAKFLKPPHKTSEIW